MKVEKSKCPVCGEYADNLELEQYGMCEDCACEQEPEEED